MIRRVVCCALVVASSVVAEPMFIDLVDVPIARLIANAEQRVQEAPEDAERHHQLARLHGMAYAWKKIGPEAKAKAQKANPEEPWFNDARVPFGHSVTEAETEEQKKAAAQHLEQAIAAYDKALELAPSNHWPIRLGHAWCLKAAGRKDAAKAALRGIVKASWAVEGKAKHAGLLPFVTEEAVRYLKPLLDAKADAEELADLETKLQRLQRLPRPVTPIAIPLEAGLGPNALMDRSARVRFDLDGSGRQLEWQWISARAAWLVWDPRVTGVIRSGTQLFGSRSFTLFQADGYAALALLDDDRDGWLRGRELQGLALWHDANGDGVSGAGEVRSLDRWRVTGLSCARAEHASGIPYSPRGVEFRDGTCRSSFDLVLEPAR